MPTPTTQPGSENGDTFGGLFHPHLVALTAEALSGPRHPPSRQYDGAQLEEVACRRKAGGDQ